MRVLTSIALCAFLMGCGGSAPAPAPTPAPADSVEWPRVAFTKTFPVTHLRLCEGGSFTREGQMKTITNVPKKDGMQLFVFFPDEVPPAFQSAIESSEDLGVAWETIAAHPGPHMVCRLMAGGGIVWDWTPTGWVAPTP